MRHNEIMMVMGDGCPVSATLLNTRLNLNENCINFKNIS